MKLQTFSKLVICGWMILFAAFWTVPALKPFRNAIIAPGSGACGKCQLPWRFLSADEIHSTAYGPTLNVDDDPNVSIEGDAILFAQVQYGMFVLCERCWTKLTPDERLPYYRETYDSWSTSRDWEAIKAAVMNGG